MIITFSNLPECEQTYLHLNCTNKYGELSDAHQPRTIFLWESLLHSSFDTILDRAALSIVRLFRSKFNSHHFISFKIEANQNQKIVEQQQVLLFSKLLSQVSAND